MINDGKQRTDVFELEVDEDCPNLFGFDDDTLSLIQVPASIPGLSLQSIVHDALKAVL